MRLGCENCQGRQWGWQEWDVGEVVSEAVHFELFCSGRSSPCRGSCVLSLMFFLVVLACCWPFLGQKSWWRLLWLELQCCVAVALAPRGAGSWASVLVAGFPVTRLCLVCHWLALTVWVEGGFGYMPATPSLSHPAEAWEKPTQ